MHILVLLRANDTADNGGIISPSYQGTAAVQRDPSVQEGVDLGRRAVVSEPGWNTKKLEKRRTLRNAIRPNSFKGYSHAYIPLPLFVQMSSALFSPEPFRVFRPHSRNHPDQSKLCPIKILTNHVHHLPSSCMAANVFVRQYSIKELLGTRMGYLSICVFIFCHSSVITTHAPPSVG